MPDCSGEPVVTTSCAFSFLHARPRVQRAPGIPCALSIRAVDAKLGRIAPRERGGVCLDWLFENLSSRGVATKRCFARTFHLWFVMAGLAPPIHVLWCGEQGRGCPAQGRA